MKKLHIYFVTLFLLMQSIVAYAQKQNSKWINIIGGINSPVILFENAYGNPEFEYSPTLGLTGGVGVTYFKNSDWGFTGSVLATKNGQNYKGIQSGGDAERKVQLLYLEAPLLVMKKVLNLHNPVWISFGPDIFYLLTAKQEYQRTGGNELPYPLRMTEGDVKERFNPFDVSLNLVLSQFYSLNKSVKNMLHISLNSSFGLTDINSAEWKMPQPNGSYKGSHNFYLGIKVGLMVNAKRDNNWNSNF